jgi:purine nucleosidase
VTRRVILDTDLAMGEPGSDIDDGFALALAVADPEIELELVTTVNGNTDVDTATRLSHDLLARLERTDVAVVRGAADPLSDKPRAAAANEIARRIMGEPGAFTMVAIGPLTNVALALQLDPRVAGAVREIVVMGGIYLGQTNLSVMPGEFNFWVDPDAAAVVLGSGAPLRLVGLDVTRRVRLTREDAEAMAASGRPFGAYAGKAAQAWIEHVEQSLPGDPSEHGSCALHDPLAVAVVTRPGLITWRSAYVQVETSSPLTRGVAIADLLTTGNPPPANCQIATDVDADAFSALLHESIGRL